VLISNHNSFRLLFDKIASVAYILFEKKYIYILTLEMASPWNQHCIGTLSFPIGQILPIAAFLFLLRD